MASEATRSESPRPRLEVCLDSLPSACQAQMGGADRLELCAALEIGGLTPGPALVEAVAAVGLPVFALIRPRSGGFVYDAAELRLMQREITDARQAGASGVVLGALTPAGDPDLEALERLLKAAGPLEVGFHRAIDCCRDPLAALDTLAGLGVRRVLSSGGAPRAEAGVSGLRRLVQRAAGRIEVMAGVGLSAVNARAVLSSGVQALHGSFSAPSPLSERDSALQERLRFPLARGQTDAAQVAQVRALLERVSA